MPATARLVALHRPDETLRPHFAQRPNVEVRTDCNADNAICLGRNSTTQVAHPTLHRRICHVYWTTPSTRNLCVRGFKPESKFYFNGALIEGKQTFFLTTGDRIALAKNEGSMEYEYRVVIENGNNNVTSPPTAARLSQLSVNSARRSTPSSGRKRKARATDPPAPLLQFPVASAAPAAAAAATTNTTDTAQQAAAEECLCAMCLEIQVQSTALVPCGHSFCHGCVQTTTECPTCRSQIQTRVHSRALDNVIAALVQTGLFQPDDVQHYQERTAANQPRLGTVKRHKRRREVTASPMPDTATTTNNNNNTTGASTDDAICID